MCSQANLGSIFMLCIFAQMSAFHMALHVTLHVQCGGWGA